MKYTILKTLDVTGFTFLTPVVLLCYGEEPRKQIKQIGQFIVIPVVVFLLFVQFWSWIAPKHKTKAGEVPTPNIVYDAAKGIWRFHVREDFKEEAYGLEGHSREQQLAIVRQRLADLEPLEAAADEIVKVTESNRDLRMEIAVEPVLKKYESKRAEFAAYDAERESALKQIASNLEPGNKAAHDGYIAQVAKHLALIDTEKEMLGKINAEEGRVRMLKSAQLTSARRAQTLIAEEKLYLRTLADQLNESNRSNKVSTANQALDEQRQSFYASTGAPAFSLAVRIAKAEQRLATTSESEYAKPWTLPNQVVRSLACAFFGFFLGSAIAIPMGVLSGLSDTFMAAMTPFIALFKPVSPIVWLPIALIIVGGFIPDPDKTLADFGNGGASFDRLAEDQSRLYRVRRDGGTLLALANTGQHCPWSRFDRR